MDLNEKNQIREGIYPLFIFFKNKNPLNLLTRNFSKRSSKDPRHPAYLFHHFCGHFTVHVQDHDRMLAGLNPANLHAGNIDIAFPEDGRRTPDNSGLVEVA